MELEPMAQNRGRAGQTRAAEAEWRSTRNTGPQKQAKPRLTLAARIAVWLGIARVPR